MGFTVIQNVKFFNFTEGSTEEPKEAVEEVIQGLVMILTKEIQKRKK